MSSSHELRFFFDYVDPASFLQEGIVERVLGEMAEADIDGLPPPELVRHPFEIRPPPGSLVDPSDPGWRSYWHEMIALGREMGLDMAHPDMTPWSRKAHELALHAREHDAHLEVHDALFRAHALQGRDIGRVDVLVEIAAAAGLDFSRTKAVLDVDRHEGAVLELRQEAERRGIRGVPTLLMDQRLLEGFADADAVRRFLRDA